MQDSFSQMLETAWAYLPSLAGALAILVGGWIVARVLAAVVRGGLRRTELDERLAGWMGGKSGEALPVENLLAPWP
jgi:hypothetical protein